MNQERLQSPGIEGSELRQNQTIQLTFAEQLQAARGMDRNNQPMHFCADTLGAGEGELVMFAQGSSARQADGLKATPADAAIVGLVDTVRILGHTTYSAKDE